LYRGMKKIRVGGKGMAKFNYKVIVRDGKQKSGSIEGQNEDAVKQKLKQEGFNVLEVSESKDINIGFQKKVKTRDLSVFCKQFGAVLRAGVPVIQALEMMAETTDNKSLQEAIKQAQMHVQKGGTLSDGFKLNSNIFPPILYNMVNAGEASGKLEICFERLASQFEKDGHVEAKIKGAMTYPIVVICVVIGVVIMMLVKVIPIFSDMFKEMGAELPVATKMLVAFSDSIVHFWYIYLVVIVGIVIGINVFKKTEAGQNFFGQAAIKLPIISNLTIKSAAATFSRTFATLLASGLPLIDSVEQTAKVIKNKIIRDKLLECKVQVAKGVPLSKPIRDMDIFPVMLPQMMHIGEETGNVEEMMEKVADFYEEEVDIAVDALTAALEPLLIVLLAVVVGGMVLAIYSPILSMYDAVDSV